MRIDHNSANNYHTRAVMDPRGGGDADYFPGPLAPDVPDLSGGIGHNGIDGFTDFAGHNAVNYFSSTAGWGDAAVLGNGDGASDEDYPFESLLLLEGTI